MSSPRPPFNETDAERIALDVFGIAGSAVEMPSYDDRNFRISAEGAEYTLKISNASESAAILGLQDQVMQRLAGCSFAVPKVVETLSGERFTQVADAKNDNYFARLLTFLPGVLLGETSPQTPALLRKFGRAAGELTAALHGFEHAAMDRVLSWDFLHGPAFAASEILEIVGPERADLIRLFLPRFDKAFYTELEGLRKSVVHNDLNDQNVLVKSTSDGLRISGVFDFGDVTRTATVSELAIACAYIALGKEQPLQAIAAVLRGYHSAFPLHEDEVALLFDLICLRLCMSACFGAESRFNEPDNEYISIHETDAWALLPNLATTPKATALAIFRDVCSF